jgi:hypothetical protein
VWVTLSFANRRALPQGRGPAARRREGTDDGVRPATSPGKPIIDATPTRRSPPEPDRRQQKTPDRHGFRRVQQASRIAGELIPAIFIIVPDGRCDHLGSGEILERRPAGAMMGAPRPAGRGLPRLPSASWLMGRSRCPLVGWVGATHRKAKAGGELRRLRRLTHPTIWDSALGRVVTVGRGRAGFVWGKRTRVRMSFFLNSLYLYCYDLTTRSDPVPSRAGRGRKFNKK